MIKKIKQILSCTNKHKMSTFSQCGEDRILFNIFCALRIEQPTYLDIGAHHPYFLSNTALFYESGACGINIEPNPMLYKEFVVSRQRDVNLQIGIGVKKGILPFYVLSSDTLSTFSDKIAQSLCRQHGYTIVNTIDVPVNTVNDILEKYHNNVFPDFLSIDAEGVDEDIILNLDSSRVLPKIICIETVEFSNTGMPQKNIKIKSHLEQLGYFQHSDTYINTIFVRKDLWENR